MTTVLTEKELVVKQQKLRELKREVLYWADQVNQAAALGDLSENAEYHSAKQQLALINNRAQELDKQLKDIRVVSAAEIREILKGQKVTLFSVFKLELSSGKTGWYAFREGDMHPNATIISPAAPLGKAILNKKNGDTVSYVVNGKQLDVEILDIHPYEKALK
jgi:transcription elongation factor GreA